MFQMSFFSLWYLPSYEKKANDRSNGGLPKRNIKTTIISPKKEIEFVDVSHALIRISRMK